MVPRRPILAVAVAILLSAGATAVAAQSKNTLPASLGDLNAAQLIEVRDQSGQVLLHGTFKTSSNKPKETERKAELESPSGQQSKGEAEVEIEHKDGTDTRDGIEVKVEKLPAMAQLELLIDGTHVASFMTSKAGKAELKMDRKLPAKHH